MADPRGRKFLKAIWCPRETMSNIFRKTCCPPQNNPHDRNLCNKHPMKTRHVAYLQKTDDVCV